MIVLLLKTTLILLIGAAVTACMRRASAASRHLVLTATLMAALLMPLARLVLPALELRVLRPITVSATGSVEPTFTLVPQDHRLTSATATLASTPRATSVAPDARDPGAAALWLLLLVASGVVVLVVRSIANQRARRRIWAGAVACPDSRVTWAADRVSGLLGLTRRVHTRLAPARTMPATFGALSPKLLLPREASDWSDERLDAVLTHELAHVRRFDDVSHTIARAAAALYWYHPLVWWLTRQARLDRERACDDAVLRLGMRPSRYAEHLLAMREALPIGADVALTMARRAQMAQRLRAILDPTQPRSTRSRVSLIAGAIIIAASAIVGASLFTAPVTYRSLAEAASDTKPPQLTTFAAVRPSSIDAPPFVAVSADGTPDVAPKGGEAYVRYLERATGMPVGADAIPPAGLAGTWIGDVSRNQAAIDAGLAAPIDNSPMQVTLTDTTVTVARPGIGRRFTVAIGGAETIEDWRGERLRHSATLRHGTLTVHTVGGRALIRTYWNLRGDELELETIRVSSTSAASDPDKAGSLFFTRATQQAASFGAGAVRPGNGVSNPIRLREIKPYYTPDAERAGVQGTVELEAVVGVEGKVTDVRVVRSLDKVFGLDDVAKDVVRQTPFTPCARDGKPVPCVVVFELQFTLPAPRPIPAGEFGAGAYRMVKNPSLTAPVRRRDVKPQYTPEAMRAKVEGTVKLEAVILADGSVGDVRVVESLDTVYGLDQQAIKSVKAMPFTPATFNGSPVAVVVAIEQSFTLR